MSQPCPNEIRGDEAVCSDDTVTPGDRDAVVASTSELGVPVTTDPATIAAFLRKRGTRPRVVFATYQSSQRIADAQAGRKPWFDLVVADEAHRCAGPEAGVFATVLDPARIKARKRLKSPTVNHSRIVVRFCPGVPPPGQGCFLEPELLFPGCEEGDQACP